MRLQTLITRQAPGYELLDAGGGEKLERYGDVIVRRPDPQALWPKHDPKEWESAHAVYVRSHAGGSWRIDDFVPERWSIELADMHFWVRPTSFKHTGLFPEQVPNWEWLQGMVRSSKRPVSILNLFGYTGGATLAAAAAGATVTHVDGSKSAIAWAKDNLALSGLGEKPVRWIFDDARAFVRREIARNVRYDAVVMDPPAFGRGAKGQVWKVEDHLVDLLGMVRDVLSPKPLFVLLNGYASGYSAVAYANCLRSSMQSQVGDIEQGELMIESSCDGRLLPAGIFARWSA